MIAVLQRVTSASVRVAGSEIARIGPGALVLVGAVREDGPADVKILASRLLRLRVFADEQDRMNRSLLDTGGEILLVSQFTLAADTRKGRRPSFDRALSPDIAEPLLESLAARLREGGAAVQTGEFGARMEVELVNDGPVTMLLDSRLTRRGGRRDPSIGESEHA